MRTMSIVTALLALSSCSSPEDRACDEAIKATLKSPSSYKRVSKNGGRIEYDAVNSFNAPLRGQGLCIYLNGKADWFEDGLSAIRN